MPRTSQTRLAAQEPAVRASKATLALITLFVMGLAIVVTAPGLLPERYLVDSWRIEDLVRLREREWSGSYGGTAAIYSYLFLGFAPNGVLVGLFNLTIVTAALAATYRQKARSFTVWPIVLVSPWCLALAIYIGMYSKETFTVLLCAVMASHLSRPSNISLLATATAFALYAYFVREYWGLIFIYFLVIDRIAAVRTGLAFRILLFAVAVTALSFCFRIGTGFFLTDTRLYLTLYKVGDPDVVTMTENLFPNLSVFHDVANLFTAWIGFLIPLRLFAFGGPQHIAFALVQLCSVCVVVLLTLTLYRTPHTATESTSKGIRQALSFLIALTLVHAAFEGDFGTYVRHQTSVLPVYLLFLLAHFALRKAHTDRIGEPPTARSSE